MSTLVELQEIAEIVMGQSPPSSVYNASGVGLPFFQGKAEFGSLHPTPSKWCSAPSKIAEANDVLMSVRAPVGPTNIAVERSCIGRGLAAIRAKPGIRNKWLLYAFRSMEQEIDALGTGTTFKSISGSTLRQLPVPIVPIAEQDAAIAEIEKQFSRLDEAVVGLKRVKANLKRYKAAILKAAVEGRLVPIEADLARLEGRSYETGTQLLQRILETRRSQWKGKGKYKEPIAPDTVDLPELPEGWVWASVDQVLSSLRNGLSGKPEASEPGIPILRISAVRPLVLDIADRRYYRATASERPDDYRIRKSDLLFVRYNGTKELVGVCACVGPIDRPLLYPDKLIRGRVVSESLVPAEYVAIAVNVGESRRHVDDLIKTTAGQQGIAGGEIKQMPLPLPPAAEQHRIVAEVDRLLSIAREAEAEVEANLERALALRQAILSKAFRGDVQ